MFEARTQEIEGNLGFFSKFENPENFFEIDSMIAENHV